MNKLKKTKQVHNLVQTMTLQAKSVTVTIKNKIPSEQFSQENIWKEAKKSSLSKIAGLRYAI